MNAETIAAGLELRRVGRGWRGACPVHGGSSFTLDDRNGVPVWTCWSGCYRVAVLDALRARGLWPEKREWTQAERAAWIEDRAERQCSEWFGRAAGALAESVLEDLDIADLERATMTRQLRIAREGGGALLDEYRDWNARAPELTEAMVKAGQASELRLQTGLAALIVEWGAADGTTA